jgi:hypothetical protein
MAWQELRRMRRRTRHAVRIRDWPWRRRVAIGAWVPVAVVAFFLFTGPNGSPSGAAPDVKPEPKTVTTVTVLPPKLNLKDATQRIRDLQQTQTDVSYWVNATPVHLTLKQQHAMGRWLAVRRKALLEKHVAATASSHHRALKTPTTTPTTTTPTTKP